METAIGVDIGGTKIQFASIDRQGRIGHRFMVPTEAEAGPEQAMEKVLNGIEHTIAAIGPHARIAGIGIGCTGQIDRLTGAVAFAGDTMPGWTGTPIRQLTEERFRLPAYVDNDVNVIAVAEKLYGAGQDCDSFVCLALGTGIGGAVVEAGRLVRGAFGGAGELGHVSVDFNGPRCGCGNYGCIELYASGTGIARLGREMLATLEPRPSWGPNSHEIVQAWLRGDGAAVRLMGTVLRALGTAIAGIIHTFNPQAVVIGGGVAETGTALLEALNREVEARTSPAMRQACRVRAARLGAEAGVIGAGAQVWLYGERANHPNDPNAMKER